MTEANLWRKIAREACERMERGGRGFALGLCYAVSRWRDTPGCARAVCAAVCRVDRYVDYRRAPFAYHDKYGGNEPCDEGRILAALWFACEANDEAAR